MPFLRSPILARDGIGGVNLKEDLIKEAIFSYCGLDRPLVEPERVAGSNPDPVASRCM
jgi:hypothetical protein